MKGSGYFDISAFLRRLKDRPDLHRAGMVLVHNGVVRGTSRDGTPVSAVEIRVDRARLAEILAETRALPGIVAAEAEIREGTLR
ncbi:molybdenum cofactor biosynthesis protein MoaE, partial [Dissulfurirhabdus thermomarina]|nr:molybdenum cofactor biosynthesis protein MoaE [Dissulfurirhabdus thermomarina]